MARETSQIKRFYSIEDAYFSAFSFLYEQERPKEKDGLIKANIKKEATYRINFCREETKKAIPKLIKKLPEDVVLDEERIENLTNEFPLQLSLIHISEPTRPY